MGYLTGAGSDYAAFMHYLGISSMDITYTYDRVRHLDLSLSQLLYKLLWTSPAPFFLFVGFV